MITMVLRVVLSVIVIFVCCLNNPTSARESVIAKKTNVFYLLGGDGIYVIDPEAKVLHRRITNVTSPGLCTRSNSRYSASECSHNSAVVVGDKVFVADDAGSAVHVIDIQTQEKVETIFTDPYPFFLLSLPWLEEVWVHSWNLSTFDVIKTSDRTKTHTAIRAHIKPGWTHGLMVAHKEMLNGEYGYVTHFRNPGIHKINLKSKKYSGFLNLTAQGCTGTFGIVFNPYNNRLYVDCRKRSYLNTFVLEIDVSNDRVEKIWPFPGSNLFVSPNGHFVVALNRKRASQMNIIDVVKAKAFRYRKLYIPGGVSHAVFYPKSKNPGSYNVFVTLDYSDKIAIVDLDLVKNGSISDVKYIENVGMLDSSPHGSSRDLFINDKWIISPATKSKSVVIINAETQKIHGMISNVTEGSFALWIGESSTSGTCSIEKPSILMAFLMFLYIFLKF